MPSEELLLSAKILIVDDDPTILDLCQSILKVEGYSNIRIMTDPRGVLAIFVEFDPDILILDISMPYLDGLQLLEILQDAANHELTLPILVMTAQDTHDNRFGALQRGAVEFLAKPFDLQEFTLRIHNLLKMRMETREIKAQNDALAEELSHRTLELSNYQLELKEAQLEVIARLARAGEQHDDDTGQHTQRVAISAALLAQGLGLEASEIEIIQRAAPLHDVGKIGVPDSILLKPAKLTEAEFRRMQRHCHIGADLLAGGRSDIVQMAQRIALTHHERWNGQGYPSRLSGEEIPIEGRILAVADVFDALTHERPYKHAWTIEQALEEIRGQAGHQFDPRVVEAFLKLPHDELV